jgi:tripartite-type tricarboxylate transporter receptor subunit TctC
MLRPRLAVWIDAIGGQIPMLIQTITSAGPYVKAGKLRALAVTSKNRYAAFADVPTLDESGFPGFDSSEWWGLLGPAGIPIAQILHGGELL